MIIDFFIKCMPTGLIFYGFPYETGNPAVILAVSEHTAQVKACRMIQAELQLTVRSQTNPVAGAAKLMADGADKPDRSFETRILYIACGTVSVYPFLGSRLSESLFQRRAPYPIGMSSIKRTHRS